MRRQEEDKDIMAMRQTCSELSSLFRFIIRLHGLQKTSS